MYSTRTGTYAKYFGWLFLPISTQTHKYLIIIHEIFSTFNHHPNPFPYFCNSDLILEKGHSFTQQHWQSHQLTKEMCI